MKFNAICNTAEAQSPPRRMPAMKSIAINRVVGASAVAEPPRRTPLLQIRVKPGHHAGEQIQLVGPFAKSVRFPGIDHHFGLNTQLLQGMIELLTLSQGDPLIPASMNDKGRRFHILYK